MRKLLILTGFAALLLVAGRLFHAVPAHSTGILVGKDPLRAEYERFVQRFPEGTHGTIVVQHSAESDVLRVSSEISEFLTRSPAVGRIISPQNARYFLGSEYFHFASLFPKPALGQDARDRLRSEISRMLFFPDNPNEFAIYFEFEPGVTRLQERQLVLDLESFLSGLGQRNPGVRASASSLRLTQELELAKYERFLRAEIPVLVIFFGLALGLVFRSSQIVAWGLAGTLATAAITLISVHLVSGGIGRLGALTLAISLSAAAVGSLFFFVYFAPAGGRLTQRVAEAKARGEGPALVYSLALAVLFAGCLMSRLAPLRELGWACALASLVQWFVTFRLLPLALLDVGIFAPSRPLPFKLGRKRPRAPKGVVATALAALFLLSAFLSSGFRPDDRLLSKYIPMGRVDLLLRPKYWTAFDPDNQAELLAFERQVSALPGVDRVVSLPALSERLLSILAMRKPGQGEKLRAELLSTLDELGALGDLVAPGGKELRSVVLLKEERDFKGVIAGIESLSRQLEGKFLVELAGAAMVRKALVAP